MRSVAEPQLCCYYYRLQEVVFQKSVALQSLGTTPHMYTSAPLDSVREFRSCSGRAAGMCHGLQASVLDIRRRPHDTSKWEYKILAMTQCLLSCVQMLTCSAGLA